MLSLYLETPAETCRAIAKRAKDRRVAAGLTQEELAARSGIALGTLRLFERTGKISLERLLRIANVLGVLGSFDAILPAPVATTLAELERLQQRTGRKYGRSARRRTPPAPQNPR